MPKSFARLATRESGISSTLTSQDGQERRFTNCMAFSHAGHPALKTSILRLVFVHIDTSMRIFSSTCQKSCSVGGACLIFRFGDFHLDHHPLLQGSGTDLSGLTHCSWPGNIRELENTIEWAVILCLGEEITPRELPSHFLPNQEENTVRNLPEQGWTLRDMEREMIRSMLQETNNNKSLTVKKLGIARQTLINKLKEYDL